MDSAVRSLRISHADFVTLLLTQAPKSLQDLVWTQDECVGSVWLNGELDTFVELEMSNTSKGRRSVRAIQRAFSPHNS